MSVNKKKNSNILKMRKKRILYSYMIGGGAGGSDTCLYLLLKNLDQSKYDLYLLHLDSSKFLDELRGLGIKIITIPNRIRKSIHFQFDKNVKALNQPSEKKGITRSILSRLGALGSIIRSLKDIIRRLPQTFSYASIIIKYKIDIVHTNHYLTGDRPMLLAALILGKKVISHNRGLYSPDVIDRFLSKFIGQIISMSDFSTSVYTKSGIAESKCRTIYDGIEIHELPHHSINNEYAIISCVGRIEKWKGQQILVEAANYIIKKIPKIKFILVGTGDNENEIKIQVKQNYLEEYFEFTGHITNVKDYMAKSTVIVHTSIEPEPFGMVIIEAMALEKPVIATDFGGPLEIIDHDVDGFLIPAQQPAILAEHIIRLLEDADLREKIGKKARKKIILKFDVSNYADQIEGVYEEI